MLEFLQIFIAFVLADAVTGLFHLITDHGIGLPHVVRDFQKHHRQPDTMSFDLSPLLVGIPFIVLGLFFYPWLLVSFGIFVSIAQIPHYYSHFKAPKAVQVLQRFKIILPPKLHILHHNKPFGSDYCVLSGWNNFWINWIAKIVGPPKENSA